MHTILFSIHVRLLFSLADWKSLNPLINPALKVCLLSQRRMTNATSQFIFFHLESTSTVTFNLLNYNNATVVIKTVSYFIFSKKCTYLEVRYTLLRACSITGASLQSCFSFFFLTSLMKESMITVRLQYYINSTRTLFLAAEVTRNACFFFFHLISRSHFSHPSFTNCKLHTHACWLTLISGGVVFSNWLGYYTYS